MYWQTRNYFYFAHQIQQPIPKLWISIFYKSFNQSDCFLHKRQQELNLMKIQIRGFGIGCWIPWERYITWLSSREIQKVHQFWWSFLNCQCAHFDADSGVSVGHHAEMYVQVCECARRTVSGTPQKKESERCMFVI